MGMSGRTDHARCHCRWHLDLALAEQVGIGTPQGIFRFVSEQAHRLLFGTRHEEPQPVEQTTRPDAHRLLGYITESDTFDEGHGFCRDVRLFRHFSEYVIGN